MRLIGDRLRVSAAVLAVLAPLVFCVGSTPPSATVLRATPVPERADDPRDRPAGGVVRGTDDPDAVPDRYIVVFRRSRISGAQVAATARSLVGDAVDKVYTGSSPGFAATISAAHARAVAAHPDVALVEQDRVIRPSAVQRHPTWSLDRLDSRSRKLSTT